MNKRAPYTGQNFAIKFLGTGSLYSDAPTVGFFLTDDQKQLFVFDYCDDYREKIKAMLTTNIERLVFYADATRVMSTLGIECLLYHLKDNFPNMSVELYASITGAQMSDAKTGMNYSQKRFLRMLFANHNLKIVITGYVAWEELRASVDALNTAIPDGPRVFLAEEF